MLFDTVLFPGMMLGGMQVERQFIKIRGIKENDI